MSEAVKLTKAQHAIIDALEERALDVLDLADKVGATDNSVVRACKHLRKEGLVDWMYVEDEVCLTADGRKLVRQALGAADGK